MALSSIASKTGPRSPGDELITWRTSAVAVCWSRASRVSAMSRAFSIAMTAWSAKILSRLICLSVNDRVSRLIMVIAPIGSPSRSIGTDAEPHSPASMRLGCNSGSAARSGTCTTCRS